MAVQKMQVVVQKSRNLLTQIAASLFTGPATSVVQKTTFAQALPVLAARDLKNSDGQTSSKNCSLNRDVACPSVGAIFCSSIGQPWRFGYHCRERRPRTPSTSTSAAGCGCAA